jgi:hypothetical protein
LVKLAESQSELSQDAKDALDELEEARRYSSGKRKWLDWKNSMPKKLIAF